ncbi:MAG: tRNA (adenosine(37)-N6)-threonylcarbamoyltransferase complex dimerization subunit type 1 TsaB [Synechococcaceae cyanobacterium]
MRASSCWLLALHSSTAELGVGLRHLDGGLPDRIATFPLGHGLSNQLLSCVEEVLPAADWPALGRLAVATGPGGFTGTRLTVVMARTLAQQLQLPLDGVGSFLLVARRLGLAEPTWLVQELPRRGLVAGLYGPEPRLGGTAGAVVEWRAPRLHADAATLASIHPAPSRPAEVAVSADLAELLALAQRAHQEGSPAPWQPVLPIYPTSPVGEGVD